MGNLQPSILDKDEGSETIPLWEYIESSMERGSNLMVDNIVQTLMKVSAVI